MKVYVASSWKRSVLHPAVVESLRNAGHEVYDYRNPAPGDHGFSWSQIDAELTKHPAAWWYACLYNSICSKAFTKDMNALNEADAVVMVMPCGKSAHMEMAHAIGAGKIGIILINPDRDEPELMYNMANVCTSIEEVIDHLEA